ncbi:hypothetical protein G6F56_003171 [Rhizopus delemar]|nr:hypothetical protein G6F56_003171 [Rhizopus delemar]
MFEEGPIHFRPTYKYDAGTNQYDTSEKRRAPSWTDRILWKKDRFNSPEHLELLDYDDCPTMMMSDHKPVRALMNLQVRKIDSRLLEDTHNRLVQQLKDSPDIQPRGDISSSYVDFETVQFLEYKEKTILLENTGQVLTLFRFMPKGNETQILPSWLQVSPISGVLAPGERVVIRFEVMIEPSISSPLNRGEQKMEDILILRLENSKDFFVSVSGKYEPTCFGVPLELLSGMSVPISETAAQNLQNQKVSSDPSLVLNQIDMPGELWKVMNFLWNANMFRICMDKGETFDTTFLLGEGSTMAELSLEEREVSDKEAVSANSMIDVLVAFLECLPDPVIPTQMYERALEASESAEAMNNLKQTLPAFHGNVLLFIGIFLRRAIDSAPASVKKQRENKIVETFTVLLRPPIDFKERNPVVAKEKREKFISELLKSLRE